MNTAFESTDPFTPDTRHIAIVAAGLSDPSSSSLLAKQLGQATADALSQRGYRPELRHYELRSFATDVAESMVTSSRSAQLTEVINEVEQADGIIAVTPVFKASYSGLFKSFWDLVDNEALAGVPIQLGATGGSPRHSLVIDNSMRPLFSYLRMRVMPTGVYAATEDWGSTESTAQPADTESNRAYLSRRIAHAGTDFAEVVSRLDARPRRAPSQPKELEVIPFGQLLKDLTNSELQQPLGPAFRMYFETTARLLDRLEKLLKQQLGLTLSEYNMLLLLSEAPGGHMRMGQLADAIVFSPSRLTYQVKVLSDRGLVKRVKCPDDGRAWQAELTSEGRTMFRKASVIHAKGVKTLFTDVVNEDQLATIHETFARVATNLEDIPEH